MMRLDTPCVDCLVPHSRPKCGPAQLNVQLSCAGLEQTTGRWAGMVVAGAEELLVREIRRLPRLPSQIV